MSHVQVVSALGEPATSRTKDEYTYLFYQNACGKECGMNDLVVLLRDSVVDAIFRSPNRHYTGTSSSPTEATPVRVARRRGAPRGAVAVTPTATAEAKPEGKVSPKSETKADTRPAATAEVKTAEKGETPPAAPAPAPKPAPAVAHGNKKVIEIKGTNREVTVPGTKTESTEPVKMAPNKANDTKPWIPVNPPTVNDTAPSPAPAKKPTT
jgi:hypothetical protein